MKKINFLIKKNNIKTLLVIGAVIIFIVYFLHPLLREEMYVSHDSEPQIVRIGAFYKAITSGQIPPRWASDLNYRYGSPTLNFFFPLEGYLGTIIHLIGFNLQNTFKILMGASFIFSIVFFFYWLREIFDKNTAFFGAVLYGIVPYKFLDMYVRGQLGEMLAFVFVPLVLLFIEKNKKNSRIENVIIGGISYALLILSHNILALIFSVVFAGYLLTNNWFNKDAILKNGLMLVTGLFLAAFFWLPALYESKYVNSKIFVGDMFKNHFIEPQNLIYSAWGYGSNINEAGGLSPYLGPMHFLFALLSLVFIVISRNKVRNKRIFYYWLVILVFSLFMSTKLSSIFWQEFHIIQQFQFPWRFMALSSFAISVIGAFSFSVIKDKSIIVIGIIILILISGSIIKVSDYTNKEDSYYLDYPGTAAYHGEATTIWTAGDADKFAKSQIEVIEGQLIIKEYIKKPNIHTLFVDSKTEARIVDNTVYFPGWKAYVDNKKTSIEFQDINHRGLITFKVPEGVHKVEIKFEESPIRISANFISFFTLIIVILFLLKRKYINNAIIKL
ncbi:hypothetical protein C4577_06075 [Candidatus Parcubacteria bacterium]|nr:MAG: hypothetical protein C4577_06075 [Candidatus Parcubacteria bacterium]